MRVLTVNEYNKIQVKRFRRIISRADYSGYPNEYRPRINQYLASYKGELLLDGYVAIHKNLHVCRPTYKQAKADCKKFMRERKRWPSFKY